VIFDLPQGLAEIAYEPAPKVNWNGWDRVRPTGTAGPRSPINTPTDESTAFALPISVGHVFPKGVFREVEIGISSDRLIVGAFEGAV